MTFPKTIAIDGPAGSGKSTIGQMLADRLGYTFVDAGQLYRAITRQVLLSGVDPYDEEAVTRLVRTGLLEVQVSPKSGRPIILVRGEDIASLNLQDQEINRNVPIVSAYPSVRSFVRQIQHEIAAKGGVVLAGRDIGTVVLPNADLKIFLVVSIDERVRRRYNSLKHMAGITEKQIFEDLERRDLLDSTRSHSPMRVAADAVRVETDGMEPHAVVDLILEMCSNRGDQDSSKGHSLQGSSHDQREILRVED